MTENPALPTGRSIRPPTWLAVTWIVAALAGWTVSFLLYHEYIAQLTDSAPLISCQFSVIVTCGPNLLSPGGNLLGFSNSIIGMTMFLGPIFAGVGALAAHGGMRRWYWRVFTVGVAAAFVLVHVFAYRSVFEYGSLCPWCMIIWLVTIPLFWLTLAWSLRAGVWVGGRGVGAGMLAWSPVIVLVDYAVIAIAAQVRLDVLATLF